MVRDHLRRDQRRASTDGRERKVIRSIDVRGLERVVGETEGDAHSRLGPLAETLRSASAASAPVYDAVGEEHRRARLRGDGGDVLVGFLVREAELKRVGVGVGIVVVAVEVPGVGIPRDEMQARVLGVGVGEGDPRGGVHGGAVGTKRRGGVVGLAVAVGAERGGARVRGVDVPAQRVEVEAIAGGGLDEVRELARHRPRLVVHEEPGGVPAVLHERRGGGGERAVVHRTPGEAARGNLDEPVRQDALARVGGNLRRRAHRTDRVLPRAVADVKVGAQLAPVPGLEHARQVNLPRVARGVGTRRAGVRKRRHVERARGGVRCVGEPFEAPLAPPHVVVGTFWVFAG